MNLNDFSRAQKQYAIIGLVFGVVVVVLSVFVIKFSHSSIMEKKIELDDLSQKVSKAEHSLDNYQKVTQGFADTIDKLREYAAMMPPTKNYYSWATEVIFEHGRRVGLEIDAVDELITKGGGRPADTVVLVESYSLRIAAQGGYFTIVEFLKKLREEQPLLRVTGINLNPTSNPDIQAMQLFIQWPFGIEALSSRWGAIDQK